MKLTIEIDLDPGDQSIHEIRARLRGHAPVVRQILRGHGKYLLSNAGIEDYVLAKFSSENKSALQAHHMEGRMRPLEVAWSGEFPTPGIGGLHCFYSPGQNRFLELDGGEPCEFKPELHRMRRSPVSWMRFIRHFADQLNGEPNPFTDLERYSLLNETDGHRSVVNPQEPSMYCETYLRRSEDNWGLTPVFRVFIHENRAVTIECYDPDLREACEQAMAAVDQSYIDEEEAALGASVS